MSGSPMQDIEWDSFVEGCFDSWGMPQFELKVENLGQFAPSGITLVNKGLFDRSRKAGFPGIVIAVCDYTREALSFATGLAMGQALSADPIDIFTGDGIEPGTPLCIGSTVVEFVKIEEDRYFGTNGKYLRYRQPSRSRKKKASLMGYPLQKLPVLQACEEGTQPTSDTYGTLKEAAEAFAALPETVQMLRDRMSAVGSSVAVATSASPFLNIPPTAIKNAHVQIEGAEMPLAECVSLARFSGGEIKRTGGFPTAGPPSMVVASRDSEGIADLYDISACLDEGDPLGLIVVEAPSAECVEAMRGPLEDIIEGSEVPVVFFCEESILRRTNVFTELGFPVFIWGKSQINDIKERQGSTLHPLTHRELCAASPLIRKQVVEDDGRLSEVARVLYGLAERREMLAEGERGALLTLTRVLGQSLRQTEMLDEEASDRLLAWIDDATERLVGGRSSYTLTNAEMKELRHASQLLHSVCLPNVALPKEDLAFESFAHTILEANHKVCLVVSNGTNEKTASEYWKSTLEAEGIPSDAIRVVTPRKFLKQNCTPDDEEVFISGWFRREEMERLISSGLSSIYTVFIYRGTGQVQLETQWLLSAERYWTNHHQYQMNKSRASLNLIKITTPQRREAGNTSGIRTADTSLAGVTRTMERERGESYRTAYSGDDTRLGKPVWFTNGMCRWLRVNERGGDSLIVVTDALDADGEGYRRKTAASLQEGDVVLRTEADDDALNEACRVYGTYEETWRVARAWHNPISAALRTFTKRQIQEKIIRAGCTKNPLTITHWISDESQISPSDGEDIKIIGRALGREFSDEEVENIKRASSIIRGSRISGGRKLAQEIAAAFVKVARDVGSLEDAQRAFTQEHGSMGQVELLYVDYIGEPLEVPVGRFGWFMN